MTPIRAVLFDALGTLVELPPPGPWLRVALSERGVDLGEDDCAQAMRAEMGFYRAEHNSARDADSLAELRAHCTDVLRRQLGAPVEGLADLELQEALLDSLHFRPYPEVVAVLSGLAERGIARVVVSNWDVSLHAVLERTGLAPLLDGVVTSAEHGVAKPDPGLFAAALALAGVPARAALHVGDSLEEDVAGARAAGVEVLLLDRVGTPPPPGVRVVRSLAELPPLAA